MLEARFRPVPIWPHEATPASKRRSRWTFKAGWADTLDMLERELRLVKARDVLIGCGLRENDIRNDGWPRSNARVPDHPGVEISFIAAVAPSPLARRGREIIREYRGDVRAALRATHPDIGGDPEDFVAVRAAESDDSRRLVYATDVCANWEHNVRSIALGLEALRAVDRYGITRRGEQYAGFMQLTSG
jgi:hypothetical protein